MIDHYCQREKTWIAFEHTCNWCARTETDVRNYVGFSGDQLLHEIVRRVTRTAKPEITDD